MGSVASVVSRATRAMEPPKKRKYPGPILGGELCQPIIGSREQHDDVSNSGLLVAGGQPAKRNRRSYSLEFKVAVLDSFYQDPETKLNQRKTAIKYGVNRRQIQKWLAQEDTLRGSVGAGYTQNLSLGQVPGLNSNPSNVSTLTPANRNKSSLSNYPSYQSKIDYLTRLSPSEQPSNNVQIEITELRGESGEDDGGYVIDEGDVSPEGLVKPIHNDTERVQPRFSTQNNTAIEKSPSTAKYGDYHRLQEFPVEDDNKPINLSKHHDVQVKPEKNEVATQRDQLNEVDSSVGRGRGSQLVGVTRTHPDPVSSHILDTSLGLPAANVAVSMWRMGGVGSVWSKLSQKETNQDGRASGFISWDQFTPGTYKMHFSTGQYFKKIGKESFYPYAEVVFEIKDTEKHYHIALLLNPFGYTTYKGS